MVETVILALPAMLSSASENPTPLIMNALYKLKAKASPALYSSTNKRNPHAPFWLIRSLSGFQKELARVLGGWPGVQGSGAQIVDSMVAAMNTAMTRKARCQLVTEAMSTSTV